MTLNGPPKPEQEKGEAEYPTPEYWKENREFKSPWKYFKLQVEFAKLMAERTGMPLIESLRNYAPVVKNNIFTLDASRNVQDLKDGVTEENALEVAWTNSLAEHEKRTELTPYHKDGSDRWGCSYYDYDAETKTVNIHFFNAEFDEEWVDGKDVSKGPLASSKLERRRHELTDLFTDVKMRHPDAERVHGNSSLYNLEAYCRLYPESYTTPLGPVNYDPKLWTQGTTIWGQFLGGNEKKPGEYGFKQELVEPFLERVKTVPLDRLADALPYPPRIMDGPIQDFYEKYGIA